MAGESSNTGNEADSTTISPKQRTNQQQQPSSIDDLNKIIISPQSQLLQYN